MDDFAFQQLMDSLATNQDGNQKTQVLIRLVADWYRQQGEVKEELRQIKEILAEQQKNPSILWLLRNRPLPTVSAIFLTIAFVLIVLLSPIFRPILQFLQLPIVIP